MPLPVGDIVEEYMRMRANEETCSPNLYSKKSISQFLFPSYLWVSPMCIPTSSLPPCLFPAKKTESLILAYEVLDSFGMEYHLVAFKNSNLPRMEQWAFFMFMIGQRAKKKLVYRRFFCYCNIPLPLTRGVRSDMQAVRWSSGVIDDFFPPKESRFGAISRRDGSDSPCGTTKGEALERS